MLSHPPKDILPSNANGWTDIRLDLWKNWVSTQGGHIIVSGNYDSVKAQEGGTTVLLIANQAGALGSRPLEIQVTTTMADEKQFANVKKGQRITVVGDTSYVFGTSKNGTIPDTVCVRMERATLQK